MPELTLDSPEVKELVAEAIASAKATEQEGIKNLTAKNTDLLGEIKNLKGKLKGFDPEKIAGLEKLAKELEEKKQKSDIDNNNVEAIVKKYENQLTATVEEKNKAVAEAKAQTEQLRKSYSQTITEKTIVEALNKREVSAEAMTNNILPHVTTIMGEDGKFNTIVRTLGTDDVQIDPKTNKPVTVDMLLDNFALNPAFAPLFPQSSGSGSKDKKGGTPLESGIKLSDLKTMEEKIAYQQKHGKESMQKLILENK